MVEKSKRRPSHASAAAGPSRRNRNWALNAEEQDTALEGGVQHCVRGLVLVIEADQERTQAAPHDEAHRLDAGFDAFEAERLDNARLCKREDPEGDLDDRAGRALGSQEELA